MSGLLLLGTGGDAGPLVGESVPWPILLLIRAFCRSFSSGDMPEVDELFDVVLWECAGSSFT